MSKFFGSIGGKKMEFNPENMPKSYKVQMNERDSKLKEHREKRKARFMMKIGAVHRLKSIELKQLYNKDEGETLEGF